MLNYLLNIGVCPSLDCDLAKRVRIVNIMSLLSISIALFFIIYGTLFNWPNAIILFVFTVFVTSCLTLILNYKRQFKFAIITYLVSAYIIVFSAPILLGSELHYQYILVCLIGLPLIFLKEENKALRVFLSLLPIFLWVYLEFHFTKFEPVFSLPVEYVSLIRILNDFLMFVIVLIMFYAFTKESNTHLNELEDNTVKLTESNTKLEQFSYIVSHDLKAPLNNIDSLISIIQDDYSKCLDDEAKDIFSMIKESSIRMNVLVSSILEYSRAGNGDITIANFNSIDLFKEIPLLINIPKNFKLQYPLNNQIIRGSFSQLEQVLTNLIGNAVKYHDKEHGIIKVNMTTLNSKFLKFEVIDDGPGIKQEYHDVVFEMFGTANEKSRIDSSGLGLSIVKKIVTLNHGEIGLDSTFGAGSNFWFTWPLNVS